MILIAMLTPLLVSGCHSGAPADKPDSGAADPVAVEVAAVTVQPMETTLNAQGTLAAGQGASARVAAVTPGRLVAVLAREGSRVVAGQVVATVDSRPQQAQAASAAAALATAQTQAGQAETAARSAAVNQVNAVHLAELALASAEIDAKTARQQAQTNLEAAQVDLARTRAGARPQEIAQAEQNVVQDQATRDRAAAELERVKFLFDRGIKPKRDLDDADTALKVATATLEGAQQQASLVRAGARREEIRAAELRLQQAQDQISQVDQSGKAKLAQARAALQQARQSALDVEAKRQEAQAARQTTAQKRADLAAAQATAAYAELRAPLTGIVTHRNANPGDMADPANPILEITDTRALNLIANLPAQDGAQLAVGMPAHVSLPDLPGKTFAGRVLSVGQVDPQTNLLTARIAVSDPRGVLKVGAFATADIVLATHPRAVVVPKQALITHDGKPVVFVAGADGLAHQREVRVGADREGLVEIVKGVTPGENVIRLGAYELADGVKVQPADKRDDTKKDDTKESGEKAASTEKAAQGANADRADKRDDAAKDRPEGAKPDRAEGPKS